MTGDMTADEIVHASAVALDKTRGVLILGPSGAGKSTLALRLMAFGARLVADDRVCLRADQGNLIATAPAPIRGQIEARGLGILAADSIEAARIVLVVDLAQSEPDRLPPVRECAIAGVVLPLVYGAGCGHLDVSVLQWLKGSGLKGPGCGGRLA